MAIVEGILNFIVAVVDIFFKVLFDWLIELTKTETRKEEFDARFADMTTLTSKREAGFMLDGTLRRLSLASSYRNLLLVGTTGSGKTTCGIIPNILFANDASLTIHDICGELYKLTAGSLIRDGYDVKVLNFSQPCDLYNPLHRIASVSDAERVAEMLVRTTYQNSSGDKFWVAQSVAILAIFIRIVKRIDDKYANLANVRALLTQLSYNRKGIDYIFSKYADDQLFMEYKGIVSYDPKVLVNIVASAKTCLNLLANPVLQQATAGDTINFEDMRKRKVAIFIQNRLEDLQMVSVLSAIFFEQCFGYVTRTLPEAGDLNIFFIIDEVSAIKIPILPLVLPQIRKYRSACILSIQNINQLSHHYGAFEKETILSNSVTQIFYPGQAKETADTLERMLGKWDVKDKEDKTKIIRTKNLLNSDEIRMLPDDTALIMSGTHAPVLAKLHPAYETSPFKERLNLPAPPLTSKVTSESVPLIPIPK